MTCVLYTSLGVKVSFVNVIMSNLATFVILTLGYLSAKLTYRFFVLTIAVLTTGRGLVAIYFFHHFLKSSWFKKLMILSLLFIFMIGLDIARNGGSFGYIVNFFYRMDINEFAWITYSFPFFDAVNGVETYVRINGPRNISEFYSNLWFHIPRVIYPEKPILYGDEIALTKLIFGVDPKNATLAVTGAGISRVYYAEYALLIGPLIDTISIIFSFVVVDILFKRFGSDATNIMKIYILIKLMRNGQEYLFTAFLWLLVISLLLFIFMNALKTVVIKFLIQINLHCHNRTHELEKVFKSLLAQKMSFQPS